jgi:hypothetical protein
MRYVCINPVVNCGNLSSVAVFNAELQFLYHQFLTDISKYKDPEEYKHVCFDAYRVFDSFGTDFAQFSDVKVLYELWGHDFNNLIELGQSILGRERLEKYVRLSSQVKAHLNSYKQAGIEDNKFPTNQLLPEDLLHDLYRERACLIVELFSLLRPEQEAFYEKSFYGIMNTLYEIAENPLDINLKSIEDDHSHYAYNIRKNTVGSKAKLHFKPVGAKTGRLGFKKGTLNVYTLPRDLRRCIVAPDGYKLVQFDFKSFQPRLAIFCTDDEEFKDVFREVEDIYSLFPGDREENKISFLAWMFAKHHIKHEVFER